MNHAPKSIPNEDTTNEFVTGWASSTTPATSPVVAAFEITVPAVATTAALQRLISVLFSLFALARRRVLWTTTLAATGLVCGTVPRLLTRLI